MKKASNKAYVSKRLIDKYQKEKAKQEGQLLPIAEQNEEMFQSMNQKSAVEHADLLDLSDSKKKKQELLEDENDENDSAEELDSDDLGDDLESYAIQVNPQQQNVVQDMFYQPQPMEDVEYSNNNAQWQGFGYQPASSSFAPQQQQQQIPSSSLFSSQVPQQQQLNMFGGLPKQDMDRRQQSLNQYQQPMPPNVMFNQQQQQQQPQQRSGFFSSIGSLFSSKDQKNNNNNSNPQNILPPGNAFGSSNSKPSAFQPQPFAFGNPQNNANYNFNALQAPAQPKSLTNNQNYIFGQGQINTSGLKHKKEKKGKYRQEVDTNVFQISMACLKEQDELATGDPLFCQNCQAIFNKFSKIEESKGDEQQVWNCEFCNHKNIVQLEPEEIPKTDKVNYILEAVAQIHDKKGKGTNQDISVVFCIDISGSMCVTTGIQGHHKIKGDKKQTLQELMKFSDGSDQRIQGDHNVTYVSRLQCVQSAIETQLEDMQKNYPERKIGLVTFNNEVTIIGDGTKNPQVITGDKLYDHDYLLKNGIDSSTQLFVKPIKETRKALGSKLMSLEETGPTALGPAVLSAIALAGEGAPGSTVIVCTDGLANVGLGSFDEVTSEEQSKKIDEFYEIVGQYAKSKGITVNIISIEGDECNIDTISKISELTGGEVQRVKPTDLIQNFANILNLPVIATNVSLKVKLHKGLEFRNEDPQNLSSEKTILAKDLGNVNEETEVTFEYKLKSIKELVKMTDLDLTKITDFPFQAQITYNSLDGSRCVRVITSTQETSSDKEELQKNADFGILGVNAIQQTAKIGKAGDIGKAQANAMAWHNHLARNAQTEEQLEQVSNYKGHVGGMYSLMSVQKKETAIQQAKPQTMSLQSYQPKMKDDVSHNLYSNSRITSNQFQKKK